MLLGRLGFKDVQGFRIGRFRVWGDLQGVEHGCVSVKDLWCSKCSPKGLVFRVFRALKVWGLEV